MASGAQILRELLVVFGVDADTEAVDQFDKAIDRAKANLDDLVSFAAKATAAVAAFTGAIVYAAVRTGEYAEQVKEQAEALGVTTDAYQELSFAATAFGIDSEKITQILSKLAVDQKAVAGGNEDLAETYRLLGVSTEALAAAKPDELLNLLADGFQKTGDASQRLAAASTLFGDRLAAKMIPLLSQGSEGLAEFRRQAHRYGVVMDEEAIFQADAFNSRVEVMQALLGGLTRRIGEAVIPRLTEIADRFLDWYEANQDVIDQQIDVYAERIGDAFVSVADALAAVNDRIGGAEGWADLAEKMAILAGATGIAKVTALLVDLAVALKGAAAAGATLAVNPVTIFLGSLAAGLSISALAAQDVWTYLQGGDALMGALIEKWRDAPGLLGALSAYYEAFGNVLAAVSERMDELGYAVGYVWEVLRPLVSFVSASFGFFSDLASAVGDLAAQLNVLVPLINAAAAGLNAVASFISGGEAPMVVRGQGVVSQDYGKAYQSATGAGSYYNAAAMSGGTSKSMSDAYASFAPGASGAKAGPAAPASVTIQGSTYNISGVVQDEIVALIRRHEEERLRAAATTFAQTEV